MRTATTETSKSNGAMNGNGQSGAAHSRALKILAKSIYRELRNNGYSRGEMVSFANELLGLVIESDASIARPATTHPSPADAA